MNDGHFMIFAHINTEDALLCLHSGSIYPQYPFYSYQMREMEMKLIFNGDSYQWIRKGYSLHKNISFFINNEEVIKL